MDSMMVFMIELCEVVDIRNDKIMSIVLTF